MPSDKQVWIDYTNYRGKRGWRYIEPIRIDFSSTEFHPELQWLMKAWDQEKETLRTFAMKDIHTWSTTAPSGVSAAQRPVGFVDHGGAVYWYNPTNTPPPDTTELYLRPAGVSVADHQTKK